jgi:glycosyltransferase involved in cell wall biosynthesis
MRVGLNLVYLTPGATGGTETYASELIAALSRKVRLVIFLSRSGAPAGVIWDELPSVTVRVDPRNRLQWVCGEQLLLPRLAAGARIDLLHSLANTAPIRGSFKRVVTIHDLHFRRVPEAHLGLMRYGMGVLVPLAARTSQRIIAPSRATKQDLVELLRVRPAKIDVVPEGVGQVSRVDPLEDAELRRALGLDDRAIVLSVSAKRPHKNLRRLIEALALIPAERRPQLVIPGYPTSYEKELRACAAALDLSRDVHLLGWVPPAQLEGLYASASVLLCPSLHEGFGLPVLEAMSRGLPVACSSGGALAEVAGDAALIFDPHSTPQIAEAIERLLRDPAERARLTQAGLARATMFSWERTAEETLLTYERALGSRA